MARQNEFQKKTLNSDDRKEMEIGAKAAKGFLATLGVAVLAFVNKDNLATFGKSAVNLAKSIITKDK